MIFRALLVKPSLLKNDPPYKITAICKDVPENSHLHFDHILFRMLHYMRRNIPGNKLIMISPTLISGIIYN